MKFNPDNLGNRQKRGEAHSNILEGAANVDPVEIHHNYTWLDSPLDNEGPASCAGYSMFNTFHNTLPHPADGQEKSMRAYIESVLHERAGKANGIEFGGIGVQLFGDFSDGFFARTAGVTLADERYTNKGHPMFEEYMDLQPKSHRVFEGDMFDGATYEYLEEYFRNEKVDFIIERLGKGTEHTSKDPYEVARLVSKWYSLLNEGGVMFLQVPVVFRHLLYAWSNKMKGVGIENTPVLGGIKRDAQADETACSIRIRKVKGSPEELPLLSPQEVHALYKAEGRL